jgi:membrane protease YdiL (CAAX protease family)
MATHNAANSAPQPNGLIANPWHTLFVGVVVAFWAYRATYNAAQARTGLGPGRPHMYLRTMLFEWLLLAIVIFGVRQHGGSLQAIFGQRWRSLVEMLRDVALGIALMIASSVLVSIVSALEHDTSSTESVRFLIPQSPLEMFLWIALSITAGICEEAVYRGYFQRQFAALSKNVPAGIILSGASFGAVHLYQGWRRALAIAFMGILLGLVAQWRKSVRPGMFAHAIQDSIAPLLFKLAPH